ncbi:MAG: hypothetical protein ACXAD7_06565 [Candidatus Kariarchaeaceae archaeon]|jgi:pyruvate formate-lyase activating enzyme-like uncharacterized protein
MSNQDPQEKKTENREMIEYGPSGSTYIGGLPEGCKRCIDGEKIVLYTTGHCSVGCAYCPIPEDKQKIDDVFVNERKVDLNVSGFDTIVDESELCLASGSGITGGDPLEVPERTINYIHFLRKKFGSGYHIHLYTSGVFFIGQPHLIGKLFDAGLDELRFHPKQIRAKRIWEIAARTKRNFPDKSIGFEIPAISDQEEVIKELILFADQHNLDFINLNEYEFTESNFNKLSIRGFTSVLTNSGVIGSKETAQNVMVGIKDKTSIPVHFCSSGSKDAIQLVQRFKRRASQIKRPFDEVSDEGELEYGRFMVDSKEDLQLLIYLLENTYEVDQDMYVSLAEQLTVETGWYIIDTIIEDLRSHLPNIEAEILARHPIKDGPITWVDPR